MRVHIRTIVPFTLLAIPFLLSSVMPSIARSDSSAASSTTLQQSGPWAIFIDRAGRPPRSQWANGSTSLVADSITNATVLRVDHLGGDPYMGVQAYRNLPAEPTARDFQYSLSYRLPPTVLDNEGALSRIQNVQFAFSKWERPFRYECAVQLQVVRDDTPENAPGTFRLWSGDHWVRTGILADLTPDTWHSIALECGITDTGQVRYTGLVVDGVRFALGALPTYPPTAGSNEDRLSVAIQLDANAHGDPYAVLADNVNLAWW